MALAHEIETLTTGLYGCNNKNGFRALELWPTACPEVFTRDVLASERASMPRWRFAKEYELNFDAQRGQPVFEADALEDQQKDVRDPIYRMDLNSVGQLVKRDRGRLAVWVPPNVQPENLPTNIESVTVCFAGGLDVSEGVEASDSTIELFRVDTFEQAAEFADNRISPSDLGRFAAALGKHWNHALLCPVRKMHGITTMRTMLDECGYPYIWHDKIVDRVNIRQAQAMGWKRGEASSPYLFGPWVDAINKRRVILHSAICLQQHRQYIYDERGRITQTILAHLPVEVRERHGDRVIGCCLALRACFDMPRTQKSVPKTAPYQSAEWRHEREMTRRRKQNKGDVTW